MTTNAGGSDPHPRHQRTHAEDRARRRFAAVRARYEGSWAADIVTQLKALDFFDWTMIFAAELLWSALPFIIVLSSVANRRIDHDLSHHIGLNSEAAHIVETLFRSAPAHAIVPLVTGVLFSFAGVVAVVASLQVVYERLFDQEHRGWRDLPRYLMWVVVVIALLAVEAIIDHPERKAAGPVVQALLTFVIAAIFFFWTMHFLLDGRVPWHRFVRPALVTALLWIALAFFSSLFFSTTIIDDSKTYGTIGVVFSFLTWFILIGSVVILGAACGAVWEARGGRGGFAVDSSGPGNPAREDSSRDPASRQIPPS